MNGYYLSWVSHVSNIRYDHATETEIVILLFVWYFIGPNLLDEAPAVKSAMGMSSLTSGFTIWLSKGCACLLSSMSPEFSIIRSKIIVNV